MTRDFIWSPKPHSSSSSSYGLRDGSLLSADLFETRDAARDPPPPSGAADILDLPDRPSARSSAPLGVTWTVIDGASYVSPVRWLCTDLPLRLRAFCDGVSSLSRRISVRGCRRVGDLGDVMLSLCFDGAALRGSDKGFCDAVLRLPLPRGLIGRPAPDRAPPATLPPAFVGAREAGDLGGDPR